MKNLLLGLLLLVGATTVQAQSDNPFGTNNTTWERTNYSDTDDFGDEVLTYGSIQTTEMHLDFEGKTYETYLYYFVGNYTFHGGMYIALYGDDYKTLKDKSIVVYYKLANGKIGKLDMTYAYSLDSSEGMAFFVKGGESIPFHAYVNGITKVIVSVDGVKSEVVKIDATVTGDPIVTWPTKN